ncbi:MAG: MFS transporter [Chloroflexota bacterium]|nr:MFS transporter [Chloroflexota bacterium]
MTSEEKRPSTRLPAKTPPNTLYTLRQAVFLISLPFGILSFVLPIYGKEIGADAVQIGLFFSAFSLMTVLLRPIVGAGLDRYGRRPFFLAGLIGYGATMFAFALSNQVWVIVVARTLQGIGSAFLWLSARAITADTAEANHRGRAFGGVDQSSMQGALLGTFAGFGVLVPLGIGDGWIPLFIGYGVVSLIAALLAWRRLPETNPATRQTTRQTTRHAAQRPIVWSRPWVLLLLVTAITGASWALLSPILMIFLQEKLEAGMTDLATAYLPAALVWALLPTRLGKLADRFGRKPLMVLGMAVAAGSSFLIPGLASLTGLAALWAMQALCYAAGDPAEQALVADLAGDDQRGRAYGLYTLAAGLGATAGPLVGGWLYETLGPQAPFYANGIILFLCTLLLGALLQVPARTGDSLA